MNKLNGMLTYLCGPIDASKDRGIGWRQKITPSLRAMGLVVIDPTNKPIHDFDEIENIEYRQKLKQNQQYDILCSQMRKLRSYDLRCVDLSSICIVYLNRDIPSCGTFEELFLANKQKKPCLIFCEQGKSQVYDWIFGVLPDYYIFNNIDEIIEYLSKINHGIINPPDNRWVFFNWDRIISGDKRGE